ncbi:hypothetical protein EDD16DRAFT_1517007 [Pisolithus croceorrhizus]|nr:hypothetical protein EV401DRAFT_2199696 [Pisolithus croceorrhizus]KAI6125875.1 hypothetical protein EDD16DRAFT_1517007 [Pisolithus croceorrhizus]KAI6154421.1 hypothetical protein EDD17DRAFT_1899993 [Pisolithus thermaeus]
MGQVVAVGRAMYKAIAASVKSIVESIRGSARTENPILQAIFTAESPEDFVRKAAQEAADKTTTDKARAAEAAQRDAEERLRNGIQPVILPTPEEVMAAKARVHYQEGIFHFAIAGSVVTQTRILTTPSYGTLSQPDGLYFNNQGLYVFDCIIVLFDNRFTQTDIAILTNCRRFQILTYIVRSKADLHIRNTLNDMGYDPDEDDDTQYQSLYVQAREQFITGTRATVQRDLQRAKLPNQRVYIVSNRSSLSITKGRKLSPEIIDEFELMKDLLEEARSRRCLVVGATSHQDTPVDEVLALPAPRAVLALPAPACKFTMYSQSLETFMSAPRMPFSFHRFNFPLNRSLLPRGWDPIA